MEIASPTGPDVSVYKSAKALRAGLGLQKHTGLKKSGYTKGKVDKAERKALGKPKVGFHWAEWTKDGRTIYVQNKDTGHGNFLVKSGRFHAMILAKSTKIVTPVLAAAGSLLLGPVVGGAIAVAGAGIGRYAGAAAARGQGYQGLQARQKGRKLMKSTLKYGLIGAGAGVVAGVGVAIAAGTSVAGAAGTGIIGSNLLGLNGAAAATAGAGATNASATASSGIITSYSQVAGTAAATAATAPAGAAAASGSTIPGILAATAAGGAAARKVLGGKKGKGGSSSIINDLSSILPGNAGQEVRDSGLSGLVDQLMGRQQEQQNNLLLYLALGLGGYFLMKKVG